MAELNSIQQDVENIYGSFDTRNEKMEYLENQNRRNNIRIMGIPEEINETWDMSESKVKEALETKLNCPVKIERPHHVGRRSTVTDASSPTKSRTIVCKILWRKPYENRRNNFHR